MMKATDNYRMKPPFLITTVLIFQMLGTAFIMFLMLMGPLAIFAAGIHLCVIGMWVGGVALMVTGFAAWVASLAYLSTT